jgi:hypothetical protein
MTNHGAAAVTLLWLSLPSVCLYSVPTADMKETKKEPLCHQYMTEETKFQTWPSVILNKTAKFVKW